MFGFDMNDGDSEDNLHASIDAIGYPSLATCFYHPGEKHSKIGTIENGIHRNLEIALVELN